MERLGCRHMPSGLGSARNNTYRADGQQFRLLRPFRQLKQSLRLSVRLQCLSLQQDTASTSFPQRGPLGGREVVTNRQSPDRGEFSGQAPRWQTSSFGWSSTRLKLRRRTKRRCTKAQFGKHKVAAVAQTAAAAAAAHPNLVAHAARCLGGVALAATAALFLSRALHQKADRAREGEESLWLQSFDGSDPLPDARDVPFMAALSESALVALHRPAAVFMPLAAAVYSLRCIADLLAGVLAWDASHKQLSKIAVALAQQSVRALAAVDHLVVEATQLAIIAFAVWVLLRLKERVVRIAGERSARETYLAAPNSQAQVPLFERIVLPFSGLASWLLVSCGCLMALHVLGINIQPLLTVGGVSGIIIGLSAQSVMANLISGVNLYLSQPFVQGDRVEMTSGNGKLVGYVERVDPMRTVLRTDSGTPVTIPNKNLTDMVISNESRVSKSRVVLTYNKARQYQVTIPVRYQDMAKVEDIIDAFKSHLMSNDSVDTSFSPKQGLPCFVSLLSLDNFAANISILLHTKPIASRDFGSFRTKLLLEFGRIVKEHGATLAYPTQVEVHGNYYEVQSLSRPDMGNGAGMQMEETDDEVGRALPGPGSGSSRNGATLQKTR